MACRVAECPELRPCAEVVHCEPVSRRRNTVVGILRESPDLGSGLLELTPADPRLPPMMVRPGNLPHEIREPLKVGCWLVLNLLP